MKLYYYYIYIVIINNNNIDITHYFECKYNIKT